MRHVSIITQSSIRSIKPKDGAVGYVLETLTALGPATLSKIREVNGLTANASELTALIEALRRLKEPCRLTIYTESTYIVNAVEQGWLDKWDASGWQTAKGTDVANKELWQELTGLLRQHEVSFDMENDIGYRSWLKTEVKRKENEHV